MTGYIFHPIIICRTPSLPFEGNDITTDQLFDITKQAFFKEAIYIASPVLYTELIKWHNGELVHKKEIGKLIISLMKYYTRMQSRCTPYGLFAACSVGRWDKEDNIIFNSTLERHTRLDMNFVCALAQKLALHPSIQSHLLFFSNNSLYEFEKQLRYVEFKYINNRRLHQISSLKNSVYLRKVLHKATDGATIKQLSETLLDKDISEAEALDFVNLLIENSVIISELEPSVTGKEFIYQIINVLSRVNQKIQDREIEAILKKLKLVEQKIISLDALATNDVNAYLDIYKILSSLNVPIEENQLFQTDLYKSTYASSLNSERQKDLLNAIWFLNRFFPKNENINLKRFKENFYAQYETAEIPILEALDTETGVGYLGKDIQGVNTLVDDLILTRLHNSGEIKWNKQQQILFDKIIAASRAEENIVYFNDSDAVQFDSITEMLPTTMAIMFKVAGNYIYLQSCGGSSAANLLGRFAHGNYDIKDTLSDIAKHEELDTKGKILAEIVHLPESRIGNILLRPAFRNYEIPYLGKSSLNTENQINLQDLTISIKNDKVILKSKKFNKEIIPRLSTAHNYSFNSLPVYHFLCDLQTQYFEKPYLGFSWGDLNNCFKVFPRAVYKNVILSRARWQLNKSDFQILTNSKDIELVLAAENWRRSWKMPRFICLSDNDNELLIDLENELSIKMFINTIKSRANITIEEFLFESETLIVKDNRGNGYTNEFIAVLLKESNEHLSKNILNSEKNLNNFASQISERNFVLGSEWIYYKFYCGVKTAESILTESIKPLITNLTECNLIEKFFFIRYTDPDFHLRIRFKIKDAKYIGSIIEKVYHYIMPYVDEGFIHKIQTDTYKREIERYGGNTIELSESLFYVDSICCINMLDLVEGEEGEEIKWLFSVRSVDDLLNDFEYGIKDKMSLLETMKDSFTNEHGNTKELKLQLDGKFRNLRKKLEFILEGDLDNQQEMKAIVDILHWKSDKIKSISEQIILLKNDNSLQVNLNDLLSSYIHMMLNRIFKAKQRTYEMVIYDLLFRYYKSKSARTKNENNIEPHILPN